MFPVVDPDSVTDWFGPGVNPEHIGVYQTCENETYAKTWHTHGYRYWDGKHWGFYNTTPEMAAIEPYSKSLAREQKVWWRGLKVKPV